MKTIILMLAFTFQLAFAAAQAIPAVAFPKTIHVSGVAEMEIVPDRIHVSVTLKEYERKGKPKIEIESIRKTFLSIVKKAGIPDSCISIGSIGGNSGIPWWRKKQQKDGLLASVTYELVFDKPEKIEQLVDQLDDDATQQFSISQMTHTDIINIQKQLRVNALRAAKDKATYMAAAIDEKIGSAITITENMFTEPFMQFKTFSNSVATHDEEVPELTSPEFRKLKLKAEMNVVFELK